LVASRRVAWGIVTTFVPDAPGTAPEWIVSAVAAATVPTTHGLFVFNVESTNDSHFSLAKPPAYVIATFATCGNLFVAAATFVLLIVRVGMP
jgi:hypothetical protein